MGKEFIEYYSESGRIPYKASNFLCCLTQYVKNYIGENRSVISSIDKDLRDEVLVDAINILARGSCNLNFGLSTNDLYSQRVDREIVDGQCLLTTVQNYYANYIFKNVVVKYKEENCVNDAAIVLVDFINYLAEVNDYDRKFTIKDLYEKFKKQKYDIDMSELKEFLEKTSKYSEKLANGENIDSIFYNIPSDYKLIDISKDEKYYCIKRDTLIERKKMDPFTKAELEEEIYALAYAYGKMFTDVKQTENEIINKKLLEMKK